MKKIRVGVADDHPIILAGVNNILSACIDIDVAFTSSTIEEIVFSLQNKVVDVLICDYEFEDDPHADGLNLLQRIQRLAPLTRVLFLSTHTGTHIVSSALALGASGFIGKGQADFSNLADAVRKVHGGSIYLPAALSGELLEGMYFTGKPNGLRALSEKELTVARMICAGNSIGDVAQRLQRSPKTISNQKNAAMKKLGATNDIEMVKIMRDLSA